MAQAMARQPVRDIKVKKLVQELQDPVLKVVRCLYIDESKVLDPSADAPARFGCQRFEQGDLLDYDTVYQFGKKVNLLTFEIENVNVDALERFENGSEVTIQDLLDSKVIKNVYDGVKILGNGELTKKLTVKVNAFSEGAKAKIEALGGTCEVI